MIPTYEQVEKSALALMNTERARWDMPPLKDMRTVDAYVAQQYRDLGRAVLAAVGPLIAATELRSEADRIDAGAPNQTAWTVRNRLRQRADHIEKEAGR